MKILKAVATAGLVIIAGEAMAEDQKFSGTWQSISGRTTYTVMVVHDDETITYCYVQSCRQRDCWKWNITGATGGQFSYENYAGTWMFERLEDDLIEGTYTNPGGDTSFVYYNPVADSKLGSSAVTN